MEPGSKVSLTNLFLHIFWTLSYSVLPVNSSAPLNGSFGLKSGLFAIANISPVFGSITKTDAAFALLSLSACSAAFSAKNCICSSIVKVTSLPCIGCTNLEIVYGKSLLLLSSSAILIPGTPERSLLYWSSTPVSPCPSMFVLPKRWAAKLLFG